MNERVDQLIEQLAVRPPDRSLDALEGEIATAISRRRAQAGVAQAIAPLGAASVGLAMALGLVVGGMTVGGASVKPARDTGAAGAFAVAPALAPSTLLEGDR